MFSDLLSCIEIQHPYAVAYSYMKYKKKYEYTTNSHRNKLFSVSHN